MSQQKRQSLLQGGGGPRRSSNMMQIPRIPMPAAPMSTYQVIGKIKNKGRFSAAQLNHILASLQEVTQDEQQKVRSSGCRLLKLSQTCIQHKKRKQEKQEEKKEKFIAILRKNCKKINGSGHLTSCTSNVNWSKCIHNNMFCCFFKCSPNNIVMLGHQMQQHVICKFKQIVIYFYQHF